MADVNKTVDIKFQSNVDQVKDSVNDLLGTLDKGSAEYEELESAIRGVTNAETDLKNASSGLNDTLGKTSGGVSAMENKIRQATTAYQKKVAELDKINDRYKSVGGSSDKLNNSTRTLTSSVSSNGGAMGLLSELTGGLAMTFKDAGEATEVFGGKLSGLKGALIASGIGLAVVIIGELIANWDKWSGAIDGSTNKLKGLNLELSITKSLNAESFEELSKQQKLLEANGATEQEILDFKKKNQAEYNRLLNEEYEKELQIYKQKGDNSLESQKEINTKRDAVGVKIREYDLELKTGQILIDRKKKEEDVNKTLENRKKLEEERNKRQKDEELRLKALKDFETKYIKDIEDLTADSEQKKLDLAKKRAQDELNLLKGSAEEKKKLQKALDDDFALRQKILNEKIASDTLKSLTDLLNQRKLKEKTYSESKTIEEVDNVFKTETAKNEAQLQSDLQKATQLGATEEQLNTIRAYYSQLDTENKKLKSDAELKIKTSQAEDEAKIEELKNSVIASSKENLNNIISGIESTGLAKTKAGQAIAKTLALTQIGIDSATALSKASTLANAEGVAAQLAFPTVPGAGTAARILSYVSTGAQVASNIIRAKKLLSSGGSGGSGGGASAGASVPASATPNVSFVASSENQVASNLNRQNSEAPPVKAYVVTGEVTTGQSLDRNLIDSSTIG